jgi:penicillin-binding protein 1A
MPKPNSRESDDEPLKLGSSYNRKKQPKPPVGMGSVILFWPFLIFHWFIRVFPAFIRVPIRMVGDLAIAGVYGAIVLAVVYGLRARPFDMAKVAEMPERSVILDRRGEELGRLHGEKRDIIRYDQISPSFLAAILAREDKRFMNHNGVDWYGVGRAVVQDVKRGKAAQGASTLTMQLARNSFDLRLKLLGFSSKLQELDRKLLEAAVSYRIEANYSKEEIITHYVNRIFWGHSIRGLEEASRTYFEKDAWELDLSESAMLAGIVRGPNAYSPFTDENLAKRERDSTLESMVAADTITRAQADEAKKEVINIRPAWRRISHDTYAMDAVRRDLERILEKENIELGGLVITTTIDNLIQKKAEEALDNRLRQLERGQGYPHQTRAAWKELPPDKKTTPEYIQGSVVAIENLTGAVLAIVGGRDADESKFNRALQAQRQLGSIFKPFVYLSAFDQGMRPDTMVSDGPLEPGEIKGAHNWHPHNSDGKFGGYYPASYGLIHSRNTMSIRVGDTAGLKKVQDMATDVGFTGKVPNQPSSFLGSWEATPMEVASAYTIFPNEGQRFRPYLIDEIRDKAGNVLYKTPPLGYPTAKPGSAWAISKILAEVTTTGTAAAVKNMGFTKPCAGKTGTTNDFKDAWFSGFTSSVTCAVWVGLDKPVRTIQGGYGATLALPVWAEVMKTADKLGYKAEGLKSKLSFTEVRLCRLSGKRATPACEAAGQAYTDQVPADSVPSKDDFCEIHPVRAEAVDEQNLGNAPPRAQSVEEPDAAAPAPPPALKAIPVGE